MSMQEFETAADLRAHYAALKQRNRARDKALVMTTGSVSPRALADAHAQMTKIMEERYLMADIVKAVAEVTGISVAAMMCRARQRSIVDARHIAIWLSVALTHKSHTAVGKFFGTLYHTSISHALHKIDNRRTEFNEVITDVCKLMSAPPPRVAYVQKFARNITTWTDDEIKTLMQERAKRTPWSEVGFLMGRSEKSVKNKWTYMARQAKQHADRS